MSTFAQVIDELFGWAPPATALWLKRLTAAALVAPPTGLAAALMSLSFLSVARDIWPDGIGWRWLPLGHPPIMGALVFAVPVWLAMAAIVSFAAWED